MLLISECLVDFKATTTGLTVEACVVLEEEEEEEEDFTHGITYILKRNQTRVDFAINIHDVVQP